MKTYKKRITSVLLLTAVLLSCCACSPDSGRQSSNAGSSAGTTDSSSVSSENHDSNTDFSVSAGSSTDENLPEEKEPIFSDYYAQAYYILEKMSLEEKIGQMLFSSMPSEDPAGFAKQYHLGGYVLFGSDFERKTPDDVISFIDDCAGADDIPLAIAVDEEGGTVVRVSSKELLSDYEFKSPREYYEEGGLELVYEHEEKKAQLLSSLHIDVNFAPVCDISVDPDDFMYDRSIGLSPVDTAVYVARVTQIYQKNNVSATLKHFPGYGNNEDTHTGIAFDERLYSSFENSDFIPFQSGIDAGAELVMVSHNIVTCMDSTCPASLSENVHAILRSELGFSGIIITDDLEMDAITDYTGDYTPFVTAVRAGNDMMIIGCYQAEEAIQSISQAVENGIIDIEQIDDAVQRILAWKLSKKMISQD